MSQDQYVFPAVFTRSDEGLMISFPDLPDCEATAASTEEGFEHAREALALHLYKMEENNEDIPQPSDATEIQAEANAFVTVIDAWMPPLRKKMENQAVKKTLTIPKWLDDAAKSAGLNYSRILQDALKEELNIDEQDSTFSVQDKLGKQLNKVKRSLRDLSRIRVHVNMADADDAPNSVIDDLNSVKTEIKNVTEKLKDTYSSAELNRLSEKLDQIADKINRKFH
ncbi:type II toxin-antitoxin system HicB family antitoxin [Sporolactobacillus vineae]|uniref:type II toxin-antitoxin system HicB family antitoxin n=1 Tax=Sporolactobacillus vineae TaxID=444463 RepID=UPI0002891900|nr:type II toxin-antitoxin system HicB family antitoxin [Sporolactobacillus vineae]